ncbi:MAG: hypothetical protein LBR15_04750 [Methanobrevibacter sp.]|jgi:hypothetical protein|nr:hypothetical protein [Candidatus Methanovirga australis]
MEEEYHYEYDRIYANHIVSICKGDKKIMEKYIWQCYEDFEDNEWMNIFDIYTKEGTKAFIEKFKDKKCSKELLERLGIIKKENFEEEEEEENNEEDL